MQRNKLLKARTIYPFIKKPVVFLPLYNPLLWNTWLMLYLMMHYM